MSGEWEDVALDDVADETTVSTFCEVFDGPHATPTKTTEGPVFLGITALKQGRIDLDGVAHLSEVEFKKWTRRVTPRVGDLVFSYETKLGEAALIPEGLRCCLGRRMGLMRPDPKKADSRFLLYNYLGPEFQEVIRERTIHGSTVDRLSLTEFPNFPLRLPPLHEQKRFAHILGTLDDKIELNRRMNATLEGMARALFQSWFIDFDPVRRNAARLQNQPSPQPSPNGRGRSAAEGEGAAGFDSLFPDSLVDSDAGKIPKEWTVEPVGDVVDTVGGATPSTKEPKFWEDGTHHWTTPKDFSSLQSPILIDTSRKLTDAGLSKVSSGLLPVGTVLISSRAPVGYLAISTIPVAINQGFIAMKCNDRASNYFMLNWCQSRMEEIKSRASGTTFAEISKKDYRPIQVTIPPKKIMAEFTVKVAPLYAQMTANLHQSRTLASTRDALLPKLMNGQMKDKK